LIVETMRRADDDISDTRQLLTTLGQLWLHNVDIDWATLNSGRQRYRVSLPTYPFERSLHWVEPRGGQYRAIAAETILADDVPGYSYSRPDAEGELQPLPGSVEPQGNVTEDQLARLWMQSLGLDQIKVTDDFFDLGGDSLLAVKLVGRMVEAFDVPIATHILLQKSTIAELAEFIDSAKQPSGDGDVLSRSPLVVIQQGNARKKPLFMVHPIGGEVYFYRDLAHQLGADQPLLAFQASSLSGREEPLESVPEMAQQYIQAMRDVGAEPPYLLGGSSFGGLVAYEMAQQFKAAGENVRLLVMIDTPLPSLMPSHLTDSAAILEYLLKDHIEVNVDTLRKLSPQAQIEYIFEDALLSGKSHLLPPHLGVPMFKTWIANQKATFAYQPQGYPGGVIFFRHTEPMPYFPSAPHEAWKELVEGTLEVHQVPGNHVTMNYPPNVKSIATHLKGNFRHVIR
jgi:thioesterase domain-containing protein/acyl carrier protein